MIDFTDLTLIAADGLACLALLIGLLLLRRSRIPVVEDTPEAFRMLENSLRSRGIGNGFTWGEALNKARRAGISANWTDVDRSLRRYEEFRYGRGERPTGGNEEVVKLAFRVMRERHIDWN